MTIPEGAIVENGKVAVKWILNRPARTLQIAGTKKYYVPVYQQNVPMYWVDTEDLDAVLAIREKTCNCNNGTYQQAIILANLIDYNLHKCGDRNCD